MDFNPVVLGEKSSILSVGLTAVFAFLGVVVMLLRVDPFQAGISTKIIFFSALFLGVWGVLALLIFLLWRFWSKKDSERGIFASSFWLGFLADIVLFSWLVFRMMEKKKPVFKGLGLGVLSLTSPF